MGGDLLSRTDSTSGTAACAAVEAEAEPLIEGAADDEPGVPGGGGGRGRAASGAEEP
jgi:hypothetical protein